MRQRKLRTIPGIMLICFFFLTNCKKEKTTPEVESLPEPSTYLLDICIDSLEIDDYQIKPGDNLGNILFRNNIPANRIDSICKLSEPVFDIRKIKAGSKYSILSDFNQGEVKYLIYEKNVRDHIVFNLSDSLQVYEYNKPVIVRNESAKGIIKSSLWNAIRENGCNPILSDMMSEIYAWQIDFFGIAKGDEFKVLYEQAYIDDSIKTEIQSIKGAIFRYHDKDYYAIPFVQDSIVEFFNEEGQSLRKAFLKAPLKFSRISSTFSNARRHPVLKIVRPHHGVDYAAPVGTPVRSIGSGVISKKGYQAGGAGNYLKVRHNSNYETSYMHLSKFATGIKEGKSVTQGEIIGYVGSTGSSTGPHLDFRVFYKGKPINPLKMESPPSIPIKAELKDSFDMIKNTVINELKNL